MKFAAVLASCAVASAAAATPMTWVGERQEPQELTYVGEQTALTYVGEQTEEMSFIGDVTTGDATISFKSCGSDDFKWTAGAAVKGSTVTITGTGSVSSISGGSYFVKASYGAISLCNSNADLGANLDVDIKVLGTDFGHMTATPFAVPANGQVKVVITLPVPNIGGTVTGSTAGTSSIGLPVWCTDVTMAL